MTCLYAWKTPFLLLSYLSQHPEPIFSLFCCEKIMTKFFPLISSYLFFQNDKDSPPVPQLLEDDTPLVGDEGDGKQKKSRGKRARTEDSSLDEKNS